MEQEPALGQKRNTQRCIRKRCTCLQNIMTMWKPRREIVNTNCYMLLQVEVSLLFSNTIGERNGNPLQYSCLENPRDWGAWWAAIYGVAQSQTRLKRLSSSSRFVIAFLPRFKGLLISWLQPPSAVILKAQENKICHCFHFVLIYLPWSGGTRCHDLHFLNVEF